MGNWRFYAQRANSGLWLDTDVQLEDPSMDWILSGPGGGDAYLPDSINPGALAEDGKPVWGKWNTILLGEEDGDLAWVGICTGANPDERGNKLEFIGPTGWLQRVPFNDTLQTWEMNAFEVARRLINHSKTYRHRLEFNTGTNRSEFTVGDVQPPNFPKEPARRKGETKSEWQGSDRYDQWQKDVKEWEKKYGDRERFEVVWWESPYIGEELDTLAKEVGFDYRERVKWTDKGRLKYDLYIDLEDHLSHRRHDIKLVNGQNIAVPLDTKDAEDDYANHVIALGAGEGRNMARIVVGEDSDDRLYQAEYVAYKSIKSVDRLRKLARSDLDRLSSTDPVIDSVTAWDRPGFASMATVRTGDELEVVDSEAQPPIATWCRVVEISRSPVESTVVLGLEHA